MLSIQISNITKLRRQIIDSTISILLLHNIEYLLDAFLLQL